MKRVFVWMMISAFVLLGFPWFAVSFVKGDGGMAVCFVLFFAVNPAFAVLIGAYAGRDVKALWFLPLFPAVFFLVGAWLFFSPGETAFFLYTAAYLLCGAISLAISAFAKPKQKR